MKKNNPKIQKAVSLFVAAFFSSSAVSYAMTQTLRAPVTGQDGQGKENLRRSLIEEQAAQDEGNGGRVDANAELADLDYRRLLQRPREEVTREDLEALFASWKHSSGPVARLAVSEIVDDALGAKPVVVDFDGKTGQLTIRKSRTAKEGDILTALATQPGLPPYIQLPFRGAIESDTARDGGVKQDPEQQLTELRAYLERLQTSLKRAEGETGADVIRTLTQDVDVTKEKIAALEAEIGSTAPDAARDGADREALLTQLSLVRHHRDVLKSGYTPGQYPFTADKALSGLEDEVIRVGNQLWGPSNFALGQLRVQNRVLALDEKAAGASPETLLELAFYLKKLQMEGTPRILKIVLLRFDSTMPLSEWLAKLSQALSDYAGQEIKIEAKDIAMVIDDPEMLDNPSQLNAAVKRQLGSNITDYVGRRSFGEGLMKVLDLLVAKVFDLAIPAGHAVGPVLNTALEKDIQEGRSFVAVSPEAVQDQTRIEALARLRQL